jgi:hypothetical protein
MLEQGEMEEDEKLTTGDLSESQSEVDENRDTFVNRKFKFNSDESVDIHDDIKADESMIPDDYDKLVKIFRRANLIRDGARNQVSQYFACKEIYRFSRPIEIRSKEKTLLTLSCGSVTSVSLLQCNLLQS